MLYYQDKNLYYFWKPAGVPSTFGKEESFLELLERSDIIDSQLAFFGKEKELGLLNRLDNDTSGLLYLAKNEKVYRKFREMQSEGRLRKRYIAEVYGDIRNFAFKSLALIDVDTYPLLENENNENLIKTHPGQKIEKFEMPGNEKTKSNNTIFIITTPIAHHRYNPERMVAIKDKNDVKKAKGQHHCVSTSVVEYEYIPTTKTSVLLVKIHKGIRHQIRVHLASIGHPIVGDHIYVKSKSKENKKSDLQLFSIGLESIE